MLSQRTFFRVGPYSSLPQDAAMRNPPQDATAWTPSGIRFRTPQDDARMSQNAAYHGIPHTTLSYRYMRMAYDSVNFTLRTFIDLLMSQGMQDGKNDGMTYNSGYSGHSVLWGSVTVVIYKTVMQS